MNVYNFEGEQRDKTDRIGSSRLGRTGIPFIGGLCQTKSAVSHMV